LAGFLQKWDVRKRLHAKCLNLACCSSHQNRTLGPWGHVAAPKVRFSPDNTMVSFTSTLLGAGYGFGVELKKAKTLRRQLRQ
jgi:hypothetical protein